MTPRTIVEILNDATRKDPVAMQALVEQRVLCNEALAKDPRVLVATTPTGEPCVGLLGILNAFLSNGGDIAEAVFDNDSGTLTGFKLRDKPPQAKPRVAEVGFDQFPLDANDFTGNPGEKI